MDITERAQKFRDDAERLKAEIGKVIVGAKEIVEGVVTCLFGNGHVLLEGVPGLGKTLLVRTLSEALELKFSRIQFTPDLMPADIIGTNLVMETPSGERFFKFQAGPIFAQVVLADEINRATPKTQSALLEAMQEHSVTVGGTIHRLEEPFLVLATQNPLEMEGTYPLPEAQLDRFFFKLLVPFPSREDLNEVLSRTTDVARAGAAKVMDGKTVIEARSLVREVVVAPHVRDYAVRLVKATHPGDPVAPAVTNKYIRYGSSPRGAQALILGGKVKALMDKRFNVAYSDVLQVATAALRHRIILNFEGEAEGVKPDAILKEILAAVPREVEEMAVSR